MSPIPGFAILEASADLDRMKLKQEDPSAVLLVVEELSESTTRPVGFATLDDLARLFVLPSQAAEVSSFPARNSFDGR